MAPLRATILGSLVAVASGNILEGAKNAMNEALSCSTSEYEACQAEVMGGGERRLAAADFLGRRLRRTCHNICGEREVNKEATYFMEENPEPVRCLDAYEYCRMADCGAPCEDLQGFFAHFTDCCYDARDVASGAATSSSLSHRGEWSYAKSDTHRDCSKSGGYNVENPYDCSNTAGDLDRGRFEYKGEHEIDYVPHGCFIYDGESQEHHGVYWNTLEGKSPGRDDHYPICIYHDGADAHAAASEHSEPPSEEKKQQVLAMMSGGGEGSSGGGMGALMAMSGGSGEDSTDSLIAVLACEQHQEALACWDGDCCMDEQKDDVQGQWEDWAAAFELMDGQTMPSCKISCAGGEKSSDAPHAVAPAALGLAVLLALSATAMSMP